MELQGAGLHNWVFGVAKELLVRPGTQTLTIVLPDRLMFTDGDTAHQRHLFLCPLELYFFGAALW